MEGCWLFRGDKVGCEEKARYTEKKTGMHGILHVGMGLELIKNKQADQNGCSCNYVVGKLL